MSIRISAIEYFLPSRVVDNQTLADSLGFEMEFLENKLGIQERHHASPEESCSSLAHEAISKLLKTHNIPSDSIELLITVTQNPDYRLPNVSSLLQHSLGLNTTLAAFDINLGCSGFVYALAIAKGFMVTNGFKRGLIVTSDPYSKIMSPDDRATLPLFGDAAAAVLIDACDDENVGAVDLGTDGSGAEALIVRRGGSRYPLRTNDDRENHLFMNGRAIYTFMMKTVPKSVTRCLKANNFTADDIDFYVFHQASRYMLLSLMQRMNIPEHKMVINLSTFGNTVSSSIPIALQGLLQEPSNLGKRALLSGFGVGLSWATVIIRI